MPTKRLKEQEKTAYSLTEDVAGRKVLFVNFYMLGAPGKGKPWILVDAALPGSTRRILKEAEERYGKDNPPLAILLTHGHFDHIGALPDLLKIWPKVNVYVHPLEMPYLTGWSAYPPPDPAAGGGGMAYMSWAFPIKAIDLGHRVQPLPVDGSIPFLEGWRYILTPGHSPGHIALFRDSDRLLIAGDAFTTTNQNSLTSVLLQKKEIHGPPAYFTINWQDAHKSIQDLADLNPQIAGTGHGLPLFGQELADALRQLLRIFSEQEIPSRGRYTSRPARANERGIQEMPSPVSYMVSRYIAGFAGIVAVAGIGYWLSRKLIKK